MSAPGAASASVAALPAVPFPGIEPYSYGDRNVFFGREREMRDLIRLVVMYRGVLLFAESGCGKSSLINAGLIPLAIEEGYSPEKIRVQPKTGSEIVVERIVEKMESGVRRLPSVFAIDEKAERQILSVQDFLRTAQANTATRPLLLIFDQFEEWITLFDETPAGEMAKEIHEAQNSIRKAIVTLLGDAKARVKLVISLREDYLAKLTPLFQQCPSLPDQYLRLTSLKAAQIADLVRRPFEKYPNSYPREISPSLAAEIQNDFEKKNPSGAVHLTEVQIICQSLFESGVKTEELPDLFSQQGRVEGVLIKYLERSLHSLNENLREPAICLLGRMVTTAGTRNVIQEDDLLSRVSSEQSHPKELLKEALQNLEAKTKLVRREPRQNVYYYEITSEFLIGWIQAKFLEHQQRVAQERKRQDQLAQQKARRRRWVIPILAAALVVLVAFAFVYWRLAASWSRQAREADSRRLAVFAHNAVDEDPELSILLALQATRKTYDAGEGVTSEAESALREASQKARLQSVLYGHIGVIKDLAFSPDGKRLASASDDGTAKIWDVSQGKPLLTLTGHTEAVFDLAFDPSGKLLATAGRDQTVRIWDSFSGQSWQPIHLDRQVLDLAFSADGTQLAAAMDDGAIKTWSVSSGQVSPQSSKNAAREFSSAFSRNLLSETVAGKGETLVLRDAISKTATHSLHGEVPELYEATEDPEGTRIATASSDGTVKLWDAKSGEQLFALAGQQGIVTKLVFAPDRKELATASSDGAVAVWDLATHRRLYTLYGHRSSVAAIAFSPDGTRLATAAESDHVVRLWDAVSQRDSHLLALPGPIYNLLISPDGRLLAGVDNDRKIRLWDISSGNAVLVLDSGMRITPHLAFSQDGKRLAAAANDGALNVWDVGSGNALLRATGGAGTVSTMTFSHNGTYIIAARTNAVVVWDASSGQQLRSFSTIPGSSRPVLSPDGNLFATVDQNGALHMESLGSGKQIYAIQFPQGRPTVCFSPSGEQLATWDAQNGARLWDASTGRLVRSFASTASTAGHFNAMAFTPDAKQLLAFSTSVSLSRSANPNGIMIWETDSGRLVHTIPLDSSIVALSANATRLVTVTSAGSSPSLPQYLPNIPRTNRYNVSAYPFAVKDLINIAQDRATRSISSQECRDYYLSGPQCKAAGLVEEGTRLAQNGAVMAAIPKFSQAKALDPIIPFEPEAEAGRLAAEPILAKAQVQARSGDINAAIRTYEQAKQFDPELKFDSGAEAKRVAARASVEQGDVLAAVSPLDAMHAFQKALDLNPQASVPPEDWNNICWNGALAGQAREVMPACESAVSLVPSNTGFRDSRGLALALTGNIEGAIRDFQAFIDHPTDKSRVAQRQEWITALKAGQNPFTPEVLKSIQGQ